MNDDFDALVNPKIDLEKQVTKNRILREARTLSALLNTESKKFSRLIPRRELSIGKLTIRPFDDESIWIEDETGEGGQFWIKDIEPVLRKFYKDHF